MSFDPASVLAPTLWMKPTFSGSPWANAGSAGGTFTSSNAPPAVSGAPSFDGTSHKLETTKLESAVFTPRHGYVMAVHMGGSGFAPPGGDAGSDAAILCGMGGRFAMSVCSTGYDFMIYTALGVCNVHIAADTSVPHVLQMKWDASAGYLYARVDAGSFDDNKVEIYSAGVGDLSSPLRIGGDSGGRKWMRGVVKEIIAGNTTPTDFACDGYLGYADSTYSLGIIPTTQQTWYIDPVGGSDSNTGATSAHPLKTYGELRRRWGIGAILNPASGLVTVNLMGDLPATDALGLRDFSLGHNVSMIFKGTPTTVRSGTFTAVTAMVAASNTPTQVTDSAMPGTWTTDLGRRIRVTSGPNVGMVAWVANDLGTKKARVSAPASLPALATMVNTSGTTPGVFSVSDPYVVETLSKVFLDEAAFGSAYGSGDPDEPYIAFVDLDLQGGINGAVSFVIGSFILHGCAVSVPFGLYFNGGSYGYMFNTGFSATGTNGGVYSANSVGMYSGLVLNGYVQAMYGGEVDIFNNTMLQRSGISIQSGGEMIISEACVFDWSLDAVSIQPKGTALVFTSLWGSGNGGAGVAVSPLASATYFAGAALSITGTSGDFTLGGRATARAWNEAGGVFTAAISCTWAHLTTTLLNAAQDVSSGARVIQYV